MEIKKEVKTILVDYVCEKCELGKMRPIQMLMTDPPKWNHQCENCHSVKTFDLTYPYTEYEYVC